MVLAEEQIKELKEQLKEQVKQLPSDKRTAAEQQIDSMSNQAIESMLAQQQEQRQKIFRMIAEKKIDSVVIDENNEAIAVLEINPLSHGHTLVIPKTAVILKEKMPKPIIDFATEIARKIEKNLKPNKIKVLMEEKFGEVILEIIPEYLGLENERKSIEKKELEEIKKNINTLVIEKKIEKIKKQKKKLEVVKLKRRVP